MLITFSFAYNSETKEGVMSGNIEPQVALSIAQQIVIAQAIQRANKPKADEPDDEPDEKSAEKTK